jgi:hypothetical protein
VDTQQEKKQSLQSRSKRSEARYNREFGRSKNLEVMEGEVSEGKQELWTHALKHKDSMWKHLNKQAPKKW